MKRTLLLAFALCGASGAYAAAPLTADETLAAYCVGVAQARVLAYEHMMADPCGPDTAQCMAARQLAAAAVPSLKHELETANATLAAYGLLNDGRRPKARRPESRAGVWQQVGETVAGGEREALLCLNMRVRGLADPGAGDIGQSCRSVAACTARPAS